MDLCKLKQTKYMYVITVDN